VGCSRARTAAPRTAGSGNPCGLMRARSAVDKGGMGRSREQRQRAFTTWCLVHPFQYGAVSGVFAAIYLGLEFRSAVVGIGTGFGIFVVDLLLMWPGGPVARRLAARKDIDVDHIREQERAQRRLR
jgi:hypothetical protein